MQHVLNLRPVLKSSATVATAAIVALATVAAVAAPALPAYGADPQQTSVSGLSSGAFMATQLQVAYSGTVVGAGIVAGGPYYCAADAGLTYASICMGWLPMEPPNAAVMLNQAKGFAKGQIDPLSNLIRRRVYVFSGTYDTVVFQRAVDATHSFFRLAGMAPAQLNYVHTLSAGHALITPTYGSECAANTDPYINRCTVGGKGYDQAGELLKHIYGPLSPRAKAPTGKIVSFDQSTFASAAARMAQTGYLYVPQACTAVGAQCKVHVALHGCLQSAESVGNQFYTDAGYNHWADTNKMLVLYPQVNKSDVPQTLADPLHSHSNPKGCWDWWGYTGADYAWKTSSQMTAIMAMVDQLTKSR